MSKEITCQICHVCHKSIGKGGLGIHLKIKHQITYKEHYDLFLKKEDEGFCLTCGNPTKFESRIKRYHKHCSTKCVNSNPEVKTQQVITRRKTIEENPEIKEEMIRKHKQWFKDNPDIVKRKGKQHSKYLKEYAKNNPDKVKERGKRHSITMRNKFNGLLSEKSDVPYFLYIIKHSSKPIIKIGRTHNPDERMYNIIRYFGDCELIYILKDSYSKIQPLELYLHNYFNEHCKVQPSGGGRTEWFDEKILEEAKLIASSKLDQLSEG